MSQPKVFVCGITGTQGGAVARRLLSENVAVTALVRDPSSPQAQSIEALGAKLFPGNFDDIYALERALAGCTAAFLNFSPDFNDWTAELRWAKSIIAAARNAGVKHILYSSGFAVNAPERLEHWDPDSVMAIVLLSKQSIEKEVRDAGFNYWTILRPGNFMANYLPPKVIMYGDLPQSGIWHTALLKETTLPMVDEETIGHFTSAAILDPAKFTGQEIELADELLRPEQILERLSATAGRQLKAEYMSDASIDEKKSNPFILGQYAMRDMVQFVDMEKVQSWGVPLSSFDAYLERNKGFVKKTYQQAA
ncbi:NAD(P)-binding protein, partial [Trichoderma sp. SZMC 28012]